MKDFWYFEPETAREATELLAGYGEKARILAGGIDLVPRLRKDEIDVNCVINIRKVPGLSEIRESAEGGVVFGAMARLHSIELSGLIKARYPILFEAVHQITSVQTKFMGTAVGNICIGTPASDVAAALMALGADINISGAGGERAVAFDRFYLGLRRTCLSEGEFVAGVSLPPVKSGSGAAFKNLVRTHADIAKINAAAMVVAKDGICMEANIAIGAAAPTVFRASGAEALLVSKEVSKELIAQASEAAAAESKPITDLRSTAEYRQDMARVLVRRVLEKAFDRAGIKV